MMCARVFWKCDTQRVWCNDIQMFLWLIIVSLCSCHVELKVIKLCIHLQCTWTNENSQFWLQVFHFQHLLHHTQSALAGRRKGKTHKVSAKESHFVPNAPNCTTLVSMEHAIMQSSWIKYILIFVHGICRSFFFQTQAYLTLSHILLSRLSFELAVNCLSDW